MENQPAGLSVVVDTSFIIDYCRGYHWTLEPFDIISQPNSRLVVTPGVKREYDRWNEQRKRPDGKGYDGIASLFQVGSVESYESRLSNVLAQKFRELGYSKEREGVLSPVDETVTQAAKRIALDKKKVAVLTADSAIVNELGDYRDVTASEIVVYSPHSTPKKHDDIGILLSDIAIEQLNSIPEGDKSKKYLVVGKNLDIGWGIKYDIALAVYINRNYALSYPKINETELVRMVEPSNVHVTDLRVFSSERFLFYDRESDIMDINPIKMIKRLNPAKLLLIEKKVRAGTYKLKDITDLVENLVYEPQRWARIKEEFMREHSPPTLGKIYSMRKELAKQSKL